jgi:beta-galactosidase GanA
MHKHATDVLFGGASLSSQSFESQFDFFPYGTQYYREPTPLPDEWEIDIKEIARVGMTHVQYRPQWICHERIRGQYTWDDTDRLFDLAAQYGVRVVLKPMMECAPDWVYTELDGYRIGFGGQRIGPHAHGAFYPGGWLPCFDNPDVRKAAFEFTKTIAARYKDHPALWFYNAWNEPRSRPLGQCQCKHSQASYREWLQKRFGTIEDLNAALGKYWTSYDSVFPPADAWDYVQMYLWRLWAADAVSTHVKLVNDGIKAGDPKAFVITHVGGCSVLQDPCCDASDDMANSAVVDRYGTSFPVDLHPTNMGAHAMGDYISSWLRRVDPDYWCHEFYPNHGLWSIPPKPEVLNRLIWMAICGGPSGFTFWQYRSERVGNETNGYGMRNIDGSTTERSAVCDDIADVLRTNGSALVGTHRESSGIKLLYNRNSDVMARVQTMTQADVMINGNNLEAGGTSWYKQAISGAHAMYLQMGETVDWVVPGDDLADAQLLHVTADEMVDEACANWLREYVRSGGKLVVEMPFACRDTNTWVSPNRPNHGLQDLLGCTESLRIQADSSGADSVAFDSASVVEASLWRVELAPTTGCVVASWNNGKPAVVLNTYGKGKVITLGQSLSLAFKGLADDVAQDVLQMLLGERLGVEVGASVVPKGVWIRKRSGNGKSVWFVFNLTDKAQSVKLPSEPKSIWQGGGCSVEKNTLVLGPSVTWVAEF